MALRIFDFLISLVGLLACIPLFAALAIACFFDTRAPIFRQTRIGKNEVPFTILKFRTMTQGAACMPTHLVNARSITRLGRFLRKHKLDELPQLWNVLMGDMSLVGPRPCLTTQTELITERKIRYVFSVKPGITGLAQLNGVDMRDAIRLAILDEEMLIGLNLGRYLRYIGLTLYRVVCGNPLTCFLAYILVLTLNLLKE